jgi:hypothetical protein
MHVTELFDSLAFGPDVEVVIAGLPDVMGHVVEQIGLLKVARSPLFRENASGEPEFQRLHGQRGSVSVGFTDQQVDVFGHHHKAEDYKTVAAACLFENAKKQVAPASGAQQWLTLIATAGDEMQIAATEESPQGFGHENRLKRQRNRFCDEQTRAA